MVESCGSSSIAISFRTAKNGRIWKLVGIDCSGVEQRIRDGGLSSITNVSPTGRVMS